MRKRNSTIRAIFEIEVSRKFLAVYRLYTLGWMGKVNGSLYIELGLNGKALCKKR